MCSTIPPITMSSIAARNTISRGYKQRFAAPACLKCWPIGWRPVSKLQVRHHGLNLLQALQRVDCGAVFHRDVSIVVRAGDGFEDLAIVDLAGSRLMAARDVANVEMADAVDILP